MVHVQHEHETLQGLCSYWACFMLGIFSERRPWCCMSSQCTCGTILLAQ